MWLPIVVLLALVTGLLTSAFSIYDHGKSIFLTGFFWGTSQAIVIFMLAKRKKNSL